MKKLALLILALVLISSGFSQPVVKLYGYEQSVLPGMVKKGSKGNGARTSWLIYFQHKSSQKVIPIALWVKGQKQAFTVSAVSTPVSGPGKNFNGKTTELVPASDLKTIQLSDLKPATGKKSKGLVSTNDVVVQYRYNGKTYFKALKKLTILEPLALE